MEAPEHEAASQLRGNYHEGETIVLMLGTNY